MSKNNNGIGEMLKLGLILVCYAVVSCTILAVVNYFTSTKIEENRVAAAKKAMSEVFTEATDFISVTDFNPSANANITLSDLYLAKAEGKNIGAVVQAEGPTYDKCKIILGIDLNGKITRFQILELSDSPGFGLKANDSSLKSFGNGQTFYEQFTDKPANEPFVPGINFDGISGATITSKGIGDLITAGSECINKYLEGLNNE